MVGIGLLLSVMTGILLPQACEATERLRRIR